MEVLGLQAALNVVHLGRAAFFGSATADLPVALSPEIELDDLCPQFGYVGNQYRYGGVLVLGINPGNGPRNRRDPRDEIALPALQDFVRERSAESFSVAQGQYRLVCEGWPIWRRHCAEIIGAGGLSLDDIAYSNSLPWRTASQSAFADTVASKAASLYVAPLLEELRPSTIVALGKKAAEVLTLGGMFDSRVIVWNRAQAVTDSVRRERAASATQLFARVNGTRLQTNSGHANKASGNAR